MDLDLEWFHSLSDDAATRRHVDAIAEVQKCSFRDNRLIPDPSPICLRLDGQAIWVEKGAAFSALEIYQEIHRTQDHVKVPGFLDGLDNGLVMDLGANFGFFTLKLKRLFPTCRILCVEPNPYVYPFLCRNIEANGLADVVALQAAVAGFRGPVSFPYIRELPAISGKGLAIVKRAWMREEFIRDLTVEGVTLGDVIAKCQGRPIDLLKMDIEGMELEALAGADGALDGVLRVVVEYHSDELRKGVMALMANRGFELVADNRPPQSTYYGDLYFVNLKGFGAST